METKCIVITEQIAEDIINHLESDSYCQVAALIDGIKNGIAVTIKEAPIEDTPAEKTKD